MRYKQGIYKVKNKDKYVGVKDPRYMSSWELDVFKYMDISTAVIKWGAEVVIIPYYSPADEKNRRYMVDLYIEYKTRTGQIRKELVEVKPFAQTQPPMKKGRKSKTTFLREVYTYNVNAAKWAAATDYAKKRGMVFRIITENDIYK